MFSGQGMPDDANVRPLGEEDQQLLYDLVCRNGLSNVFHALTGLGGHTSRASILSANTLLSNTSAPSLAWTSSEASISRSDAASIRTQSTWQDNSGSDAPSLHEGEGTKFNSPAWLDSPGILASPMAHQDALQHPSPRPVPTTNKKYQCPMCFLDNNPVGFGRKSDFKKHLHNFHGADVVWICRTKGCHLSFATERAYSTHAKETHRMEALPNSAARTDLCPQVVFSCGFPTCKDRIFEASTKDDSSNCRDKYFEHIAKHFEDGFDVNSWAYSTQVQNLMRQKDVKQIFKTSIWPKERRQQLNWQPRSSGDLRRLLECRHLGEDVSRLVRLAYILGTAPFTSARTPPPNDIDTQFSLPVRSQCLIDAASHTDKDSKEDSPTPTDNKRRPSVPQVVLNTLTNRRSRRDTRPSTPVSAAPDTSMSDGLPTEPHPGTPIHIPGSSALPSDAPTFAPEQSHMLPKQVLPLDSHIDCSVPDPAIGHGAWPELNYAMAQDTMGHEYYDTYHVLGSSQTSSTTTVRPATPTPHKRPASWSKRMSLESLRPKKKTNPHYSAVAQAGMMPQSTDIPNAFGEPMGSVPVTMGMPLGAVGYDIPMRMAHEDQSHYHHQQQHILPSHHPDLMGQPHMMVETPQTFFIDDGDGQIM